MGHAARHIHAAFPRIFPGKPAAKRFFSAMFCTGMGGSAWPGNTAWNFPPLLDFLEKGDIG
jgi:hypothetical protein